MFEFIADALRGRSKVSAASQMALKGSARQEALLEILNFTRGDAHHSSYGMQTGLTNLKAPGISDTAIYLGNPFPQYRSHTEDHATYNAELKARKHDQPILSAIMDGSYDLNKTLVWVMEVQKRDAVKDRIAPGEVNELVSLLQAARYTDPGSAKDIIRDKCQPILDRWIPPAHHVLKEVVSKRLFSAQAPAERICVAGGSSMTLTQGIVDNFVKRGSKVIMTVPYFDPFPVLFDAKGAEVITADTTKTGFKLQAGDLRKLIKDNKMGPDDWLFMTSPNNTNMIPYTRNELQAIADVVAETGVRVICDELYARFDKEPHVSLASLDAWGPSGQVYMKDKVFTVSGCSKQFPFGSDEKRKLGVAMVPTKEDAKKLDAFSGRLNRQLDDDNSMERALKYTVLLTSTPGRLRDECSRMIHENSMKVRATIDGINERFAKTHNGVKAFELLGCDSGYLACLRLSPELCDKVGIKSSDDLMGYLFAMAGIYTKSLTSEGVNDPIVRLNVNEMAEKISDMEERLEKMANAVMTRVDDKDAPPHSYNAPTVAKVNEVINKLIYYGPNIKSEQFNHAQR